MKKAGENWTHIILSANDWQEKLANGITLSLKSSVLQKIFKLSWMSRFHYSRNQEEREYPALTARLHRRHCGGEIRMASLFATHAVFTTSCIRWIILFSYDVYIVTKYMST